MPRAWRVRLLAIALTAAMAVATAYMLARRTSHGVYLGTWRFHVELVFDRAGIYLGANRGPRSVGGVGYDRGGSLKSWAYLSRVGGTSAQSWGGVRLVTAPFLLFIFVLPWWLPSLIAALAVVLSAIPVIRNARRAEGTCAACGYDLRATPDQCPECGATSAPARTIVTADATLGLWSALTAAVIALPDVLVGPRGRLPDWADLVFVIAFLVAVPALVTAAWLQRSVRGRVAVGLLALLLACGRCLLVKLN